MHQALLVLGFGQWCPTCYFSSTRGLRQGDPLSPSLFVLVVDYLSRSLDKLFSANPDMKYRAYKSGFPISHLSYADDITIFIQARREGLQCLMGCLDHYVDVSGKMIDRVRSSFYVWHTSSGACQQMIEEICGYQREVLLVPIWGCQYTEV